MTTLDSLLAGVPPEKRRLIEEAASLPVSDELPPGVRLPSDLDVERVRRTIAALRSEWTGEEEPAQAFVAEYERQGEGDQ